MEKEEMKNKKIRQMGERRNEETEKAKAVVRERKA